MTTQNMSFSEYQANQPTQDNNPWAKRNPTSADHFQMIVEQNMRDGQSSNDAQLDAVQAMKQFKADNVSPMGSINARDAGYNEAQGAQLQRDGQVWQQQQDANRNSTIDDFNQWRMQQGQAPMSTPPGNNSGWEGANDALQNLRNLELPKFKR